MRTIKPGKKLPEKTAVCKYCEEELAYTEKDVHIYHEEWSHEYYIICPNCGRRIVLRHVAEGC